MLNILECKDSEKNEKFFYFYRENKNIVQL